ncbi:MAG TPA: MerR family transcriptional regulator [Dehalococcoidia bacterium]|nr:MerR family transcriptional regulator [Dehalococcoidia bacterium]
MATEQKERPRNEPYLQIGEVADRTGVTQRTLRFYEERGLLKPPSRMEGGFRLYSEEDVGRVEQIKRLQSLLGLTLAEIKEMVEAEETKTELRATYRPDLDAEARIARLVKAIEVTERQSQIIGAKVNALIEMKADLEAKLQRYRAGVAELREHLEKEHGGAVYPTR